MTYTTGDPGHIQAHSDLVAAVNTELARFGNLPDLPTRAEGDEGHLDDHNAIRAALELIETTAGQAYSSPLPPVRNLGDTGHTDDHNALAAAVLEASSWPAWNAATGGLEQMVTDYNGTGQRWMVHTFTGNGTFTVTRGTQPFRVLVVGGGGNGGASDLGTGGGGAGGVIRHDSLTLAAGQHSVTVGARSQASVFSGETAAPGSNGGNGAGGVGGASGAPTSHSGGGTQLGAGVSTGSGGGGAGGGSANVTNYTPTPGGVGLSSDIRGTVEWFAGGGGATREASGGYSPGGSGVGGAGKQFVGGDATANTGSGGGGCTGLSQHAPGGVYRGGYGAAGVVIVAYRVA